MKHTIAAMGTLVLAVFAAPAASALAAPATSAAPAPASAVPVAAHDLGQSYVFLRVYEDSVGARLEITVDDLERALQLGWSSREGVAREEVQRHLAAILEFVGPRFRLWADGEELALRFTGMDLRHIEIAEYVLLDYVVAGVGARSPRLDVEYSAFLEPGSEHRNLLVIEQNWGTGTINNESRISLIFGPGNPRQTLDLSEPSTLRGFMALVRMGVHHIWIGIDHILFLFALILPAVLRRRNERWEPVASFRPALLTVAAIVTCFTIAHSVTLSLAVLGLVRLPPRFVEATIAASIAAAALYNLYPRLVVKEWMIAFAFGLFHGFGFANVLGELTLEPSHLALSLVGFNLGVEAGQLAIIVVLFPALYAVRARPFYRPALRYASVALIAIATFWFVERAFELPLTAYARSVPELFVRRLSAQG